MCDVPAFVLGRVSTVPSAMTSRPEPSLSSSGSPQSNETPSGQHQVRVSVKY